MKSGVITGATGWVGSRLLGRLFASGFQPIAALRGSSDFLPPAIPYVHVGDLLANTDWTRALVGVEVVVHAAARVHIMNDRAADPLREFRQINVAGTLTLAHQA